MPRKNKRRLVWLLSRTCSCLSVARMLPVSETWWASNMVLLMGGCSSFTWSRANINPHWEGHLLIKNSQHVISLCHGNNCYSHLFGYIFKFRKCTIYCHLNQVCMFCHHRHTWSPAFGPSVLKRMGRHRLSSFIKLEFWKCAIRAAFPWMRAYASDATFSLLNFSHFFPLNACKNQTILLALICTCLLYF